MFINLKIYLKYNNKKELSLVELVSCLRTEYNECEILDSIKKLKNIIDNINNKNKFISSIKKLDVDNEYTLYLIKNINSNIVYYTFIYNNIPGKLKLEYKYSKKSAEELYNIHKSPESLLLSTKKIIYGE